jgi:hypothetical protein
LNVATTIIGFGNSLYAINSHFYEMFPPLSTPPADLQSEVVRLRK